MAIPKIPKGLSPDDFIELLGRIADARPEGVSLVICSVPWSSGEANFLLGGRREDGIHDLLEGLLGAGAVPDEDDLDDDDDGPDAA